MAESFEAQMRRLAREMAGLSGEIMSKSLKTGIRAAAKELRRVRETERKVKP